MLKRLKPFEIFIKIKERLHKHVFVRDSFRHAHHAIFKKKKKGNKNKQKRKWFSKVKGDETLQK